MDPDDARTMRDDCVALHEIYVSLREAGFTEDEALCLIGYVLVGKRKALLEVRRLLP